MITQDIMDVLIAVDRIDMWDACPFCGRNQRNTFCREHDADCAVPKASKALEKIRANLKNQQLRGFRS